MWMLFRGRGKQSTCSQRSCRRIISWFPYIVKHSPGETQHNVPRRTASIPRFLPSSSSRPPSYCAAPPGPGGTTDRCARATHVRIVNQAPTSTRPRESADKRKRHRPSCILQSPGRASCPPTQSMPSNVQLKDMTSVCHSFINPTVTNHRPPDVLRFHALFPYVR